MKESKVLNKKPKITKKNKITKHNNKTKKNKVITQLQCIPGKFFGCISSLGCTTNEKIKQKKHPGLAMSHFWVNWYQC